jgi:hypothetical protein
MIRPRLALLAALVTSSPALATPETARAPATAPSSTGTSADTSAGSPTDTSTAAAASTTGATETTEKPRSAARPAKVVAAPTRAALPDPAPPSANELAIFRGVTEDDDVLRIPPCKRVGMATTDCRDPMSYITSNEVLQRVWLPFIRDLGGAFVGLGSDQAYSFIAAAKSRWAWIFDYDPAVVRVHKILQALVREHDTPAAFLAAFDKKNEASTRARLAALLADDAEKDAILALFDASRGQLATHYQREAAPWTRKDFGWLNDAGRYSYIRLLITQGRVIALKGNMLTNKVLPGIAAAATKLAVPVRIYYPSNAEEMWPFTPQYRTNVTSFPFDDESVIIRTHFNKKGGWDAEKKYWHYVVHKGTDAQQVLRDESVTTTKQMMRRRRPTAEPILSAIGFP